MKKFWSVNTSNGSFLTVFNRKNKRTGYQPCFCIDNWGVEYYCSCSCSWILLNFFFNNFLSKFRDFLERWYFIQSDLMNTDYMRICVLKPYIIRSDAYRYIYPTIQHIGGTNGVTTLSSYPSLRREIFSPVRVMMRCDTNKLRVKWNFARPSEID